MEILVLHPKLANLHFVPHKGSCLEEKIFQQVGTPTGSSWCYKILEFTQTCSTMTIGKRPRFEALLDSRRSKG
jgi:hypothetical protein